jgi:hypothetical protein
LATKQIQVQINTEKTSGQPAWALAIITGSRRPEVEPLIAWMAWAANI